MGKKLLSVALMAISVFSTLLLSPITAFAAAAPVITWEATPVSIYAADAHYASSVFQMTTDQSTIMELVICPGTVLTGDRSCRWFTGSSFDINHRVTINGLHAKATYIYRVQLSNRNGVSVVHDTTFVTAE